MSGKPTAEESFPLFLRLPSLLRHHIYRFVELASWDGSPYIFDLHSQDRESRGGGGSELARPTPRVFYGLLLSCRDIYAEAAALLYSANVFVVHYTDPGSLAPLLSLTAPALSSLGALKIVLNQASCHHQTPFSCNEDCCADYSDWPGCQYQLAHSHRHQLPLLSSVPRSPYPWSPLPCSPLPRSPPPWRQSPTESISVEPIYSQSISSEPRPRL